MSLDVTIIRDTIKLKAVRTRLEGKPLSFE